MCRLFKSLIFSCAILLLAISLISCGGGGSDTTGVATGTLLLGLTDDPGDYLNVYVTIEEVQVNKAAEEEGDESGWITVSFNGPKTIDLLELDNGNIFTLVEAELETGRYNQMRLILGTEPDDPEVHNYANYLVIEGAVEGNSVEEPLKVPSGFQTGIKIVKGFEIVAQGITALILDFDANKSIVKAGMSGQWLLKPTIKVLETADNSVGDNAIAGTDGGVDVSAQIYTPQPSEPTAPPWDPMDEVTVEGTAESDGEGYYKIYLPPNTYNVVATKDGFITKCLEVRAEFFEELTDVDFVLEEVAKGTVSGTVSGLGDGDLAHLSIRQQLTDCEGEEEEAVIIEVKSLPNLGNDTLYSIFLPVGDYQIVAWADEEDTLEFSVAVKADTETVQNISF